MDSATDHISVGKRGEQLAKHYLKKNGFRVLALNYETKIGELDIVARSDDKSLVFVEVKTLSTTSDKFERENRMFPEQHLTPHKLQKLIRLAQLYIAKEKPKTPNGWQIDLIAIDLDQNTGDHQIRHLPRINH